MTKLIHSTQSSALKEELTDLAITIEERIYAQFPSLKDDRVFQQQLEVIIPDKGLKRSLDNPYDKLIHELKDEEKILLNLALGVHLAPSIFNIFLAVEGKFDSLITSFGGYRVPLYGKFIPTYQTVFYILTGTDVEQRLQFHYLLEPNHLFYERGILQYPSKEVSIDSHIALTPEYLQLLSNGKAYQPQYSTSFPAQQITTGLEWDNLVLSEKVLAQIKEIEYWILHQNTIMEEWQLGKQLKKGYKAIFYGPSGTGKTLTTTLLGKSTGLPVYRTDMSAVVSKYIGETEKNLENLFKVAENKNWILFFDEAESLFAKRGAVKDASDQYANQTITYLLQRIEDYNGVVILATNKPTSIDDAFKRRFQNIVEFPKPNEAQRLRLWEQAFKGTFTLDEVVDLSFLAKHYDRVTGGILINILRDCAIKVAQRGNEKVVIWEDIIYSLQKQYQKHAYMWTDPVKKGWQPQHKITH
ncbi:MAG: ATP-binding protein [Bacteroidota bacterium]